MEAGTGRQLSPRTHNAPGVSPAELPAPAELLLPLLPLLPLLTLLPPLRVVVVVVVVVVVLLRCPRMAVAAFWCNQTKVRPATMSVGTTSN